MEFEHGQANSLNKKELFKTLEQAYIGHLGCALKDDIYVVPITYVFEDPYIYSHSKDGKKISMMRKNPHVCLEVDEVRDLFDWKSVIVWGRFEELRGEAATRAMRQIVHKIIEKNPQKKFSPLEMDFAALFEKSVVYRIHVEKISGRYEGTLSS